MENLLTENFYTYELDLQSDNLAFEIIDEIIDSKPPENFIKGLEDMFEAYFLYHDDNELHDRERIYNAYHLLKDAIKQMWKKDYNKGVSLNQKALACKIVDEIVSYKDPFELIEDLEEMFDAFYLYHDGLESDYKHEIHNTYKILKYALKKMHKYVPIYLRPINKELASIIKEKYNKGIEIDDIANELTICQSVVYKAIK